MAAVEGLGERMVEDGVREKIGGQTGQDFAGPCNDQECYFREVAAIDQRSDVLWFTFKSSFNGVLH